MKPGEQFFHAITEPTNKGQKLFVGTLSGPMHVYHIMILKLVVDSAGENSLSCFWRTCLPLVLCLASHCYCWNGSMGPYFRSDTV